MKIILSELWRKEIKAWLLIEGICVLLSCIWFREDIKLMVFMFLFIFLLSTATQIIVLRCEYRFFTYVIDTENHYKSFLLKKQLCVINKQEKIYYAIFFAKEAMFTRRRFIIISNRPFKYEDRDTIRMFPWDKKPLLASYDVRTQIAMPYDEQTKDFIKIEKWICVN